MPRGRARLDLGQGHLEDLVAEMEAAEMMKTRTRVAM